MRPPPAPIRAFRRLREAGPTACRFAARAWLAALPVELSLATLGLARTIRWIDWLPARRAGGADAVSVAEGEQLVGRAYRMLPLPGRCLARSLVQYLLHHRDGVGARIVYGVRRDRSLEAHAWVEPLGGTPRDTGFAPLAHAERTP